MDNVWIKSRDTLVIDFNQHNEYIDRVVRIMYVIII